MQGSIIALTLSGLAALATSMALEPRQSNPVRFVSAKRLDGNCPANGFFFKPGEAGQPFATIVFGDYSAYVGPDDPSSSREKFCNFEVVLEFPLGCTTGNFQVFPRGYLQLQDARTTAEFKSQNTLPGVTDPNSDRVLQWTGPANNDTLVEFWQLPLREDIRNDNERRITFTARTRILVTQPGPTEQSFLQIDSLDVGVVDTASC